MSQNEILMREAMRILGVKTKHTMRKWHTNGTLPAEWREIAGVRVRVYDRRKVLQLKARMNKERKLGETYIKRPKK